MHGRAIYLHIYFNQKLFMYLLKTHLFYKTCFTGWKFFIRVKEANDHGSSNFKRPMTTTVIDCMWCDIEIH